MELKKAKNNSTIIARKNEIEAIVKHFNCVLEGCGGLVVISGPPGIGKTFLIEEVIKDLAGTYATFLYGKFRNYKQKSFQAISEIIEQIIKYFLTLPNELLESIKETLRNALGSDMRVITTICPLAKKLLGDYKPIEIDDYEKVKYRVKIALYQFFATVSEALFPMIIFIDDLQWADTPSLEVIELISRDIELLNFFLILTYRNDKQNNLNKLDNFNRILQNSNGNSHYHLRPFTDSEIREYLKVNLGSNIENREYLSRIIYGLSLGNPFFIKEIVELLTKEGILFYSKQKKSWIVKIELINDLRLPADIEQILTNKLMKLRIEDKAFLEQMACLDSNVEYELLKEIFNYEDGLLINKITNLCEAGFLIKKTDVYQGKETISYGFVHDILFEFIYNNIESVKKSKIHFRIAKSMANDRSKDFTINNRLFLASQLLRADFQELTQNEPERWVAELYYAGIEAKQTATIEQALRIFERCKDVYSLCEFENKHNLGMKINLELAECLFICQRFEEAQERFEGLIASHNTVEDLVIIKRKYMKLYSYYGNSEKVIELGLEILNHLNYKFDTKHIIIEIIKGKILFSNRGIEKLKNAPLLKDKRIICILETLTQMIPAAHIINEKIFDLVILKIGNLSAKHGISPYASIGFGAYSYILNTVWKDYEKGKKLENITLELLKDIDDSLIKTIVYSLLGTFIIHWSSPLGKTRKYLERAIEESTKAGEFIFSGYCIVSIMYANYVMGMPLKEVIQYVNKYINKIHWIADDVMKFIDQIFNRHIHYLEKGVLTEEDYQIEEEINLSDNNKRLVYITFLLQRSYLTGKIEIAFDQVEEITPNLGLLKGHIIYIDLLFFCLLVRLARHEKLSLSEKKKNKRIIEKYMKELKYWINYYKENHYARYLLVKAEYIALFQKDKSIEKLYNDAIDFAEAHDYLSLEAMGNLLAAKHYKYNKKLSQFYALEAARLFDKWGAHYIGGLIEKDFELRKNCKMQNKEKMLKFKMGKTEKITKGKEINNYLINHLKNIENLEEEQGFLYLLDFFGQGNFAEYGAVLFEKNDEMYLHYLKKGKEPAIKIEPKNMKHVSCFSRKIIRYAVRTGEEVIINKKPNEGIFTKDKYIMEKDQVSIVCIPINYLGVLVGIIYLEKNSLDGFDEDIVPFTRSIISSIVSKRVTKKDGIINTIKNPKKKESPLTNRELEIIKLAAQGLPNSAISKELYISLGTVKNHLSNIYGKLEVDSRIKAVLKAKEMKILDE